MLRFHVTLHAAPPESSTGPPMVLGNATYTPLAIASNELTTPFAVTFEEVCAALSNLPRMFCEPDGYLLWSGGSEAKRWQIDGHLFDRHERLLYVALKGSCPAESFDALLRAFGWPATPLLFQLQTEGLVLAESEFRRWAAIRH